MKYIFCALSLCAAAGVFAVGAGDSADGSRYPAYQDARKDYQKQVSYCGRVPLMSEEYEVRCRDLPEERPVAPE